MYQDDSAESRAEADTDQSTLHRLADRAKEREAPEDVVRRLLNETATVLTIEEFLHSLVEEAERNIVIQVNEASPLSFVVHTGLSYHKDLPAIVRDVDRITINGANFNLYVDASPYGPQADRLTVYNGLSDSEEVVSVKEGCDRLKDWVSEKHEKDLS